MATTTTHLTSVNNQDVLLVTHHLWSQWHPSATRKPGTWWQSKWEVSNKEEECFGKRAGQYQGNAYLLGGKKGKIKSKNNNRNRTLALRIVTGATNSVGNACDQNCGGNLTVACKTRSLAEQIVHPVLNPVAPYMECNPVLSPVAAYTKRSKPNDLFDSGGVIPVLPPVENY